MKQLRVGVIGASGRMGLEILSVLEKNKSTSPALGIVRTGKAAGYKNSSTKLEPSLKKQVDVLVDFSTLENFEAVVKFCAKENIPLVSGTTGLGAKEKKSLLEAAKKTPILWSPNMSLGVSALKEALKALSGLKGFDFQIEEFHHNKKKDNPSGTALWLQEELEKNTKAKVPQPVGIRGGGIFGVHKVYAMSESEVLCFEHQALNRKVFAEGAVAAAVWLAGKKPGLYQLKDVIS